MALLAQFVPQFDGSGRAQLNKDYFDSSATQSVGSSNIIPFPGVTLEGVGTVTGNVNAAGTLAFVGPSFTATGIASSAAIAAGTISFTGLNLAGNGSLLDEVDATGVLGFAGPSISASGTIERGYTGTGSLELGGLVLDGTGFIISAPVVVDPEEPSGKFCGTGLYGLGKLPGDPSLDESVLTAVGTVGAVALSWLYPVVNPFAVAHTLIYRSTQDDFDLAPLIRTQSGDYYRDEDVEEGTRYYYWIRMVSVNGTVGDAIGPASAVPQPTVAALIDILENRISSSLLNQELRTQIATITDLSSSLSNEEQERLLGDNYFTQLLESYRADLDAVDTLVRNEVIERVTGNSALVAEVDIILAQVNDTAAAILEESAVRATETDALALQINTLQATAGGDTASVQELQQVVAGAGGLSAQFMLKTDVNGYVSGFGLYNDGATSQFIVNVDDFAIGKPGEQKFPFIIGDVNGETQIALNARTLIPDGHITNAMIENIIQSSNYSPGSNGWIINKNGNAEFNNIKARGDIEASSIKAGAVVVDTLNVAGNAITANQSVTGGTLVATPGNFTTLWSNVFSFSDRIERAIITMTGTISISGGDNFYCDFQGGGQFGTVALLEGAQVYPFCISYSQEVNQTFLYVGFRGRTRDIPGIGGSLGNARIQLNTVTIMGAKR